MILVNVIETSTNKCVIISYKIMMFYLIPQTQTYQQDFIMFGAKTSPVAS